MNSIIAVDFETANPKRVSACAVGGCVIKDDQIVETFSTLLAPPIKEFSPINVRIHGITPEMVQSAPTFLDVFSKYRDHIEKRTIISYSKFDLSVINNLLDYYDIDCSFTYVDVCEIAKQKILGLKNYKLTTVCQYLGFEKFNHHHAAEDAFMCARVYLALKGKELQKRSTNSPDFSCEPFVRFVSSITADGLIDYKEAYEFYCFLEMLPQTSVVKSIMSKVSSVLEDGIVSNEESGIIISMLRDLVPSAFSH